MNMTPKGGQSFPGITGIKGSVIERSGLMYKVGSRDDLRFLTGVEDT